MSIYKTIPEIVSSITVPTEKYEDGIRASERNEIIKRMLKRGYLTYEGILDVLDISDDGICSCKCGVLDDKESQL